MSDDTADERVVVGRIIKPHGIRGEVSVQVLTDRPERFAPGSQLTGGSHVLVVGSSRPHQGRLLVQFEGVEDRSHAERLRGLELEALADDQPGGDAYLVSELVGMRVVDEDGRTLGEVAASVELPPAAAYDLLEILAPDGSSWLLPAVDEYVAVDEDGDRLVVFDPPEGLVPDVPEA